MHVSFLTGLYFKCGYEDLRCLLNKTNMPEGKPIPISSTFSQMCKQETKYNISDITLWKNINCVMFILIFVHDTHKNLNNAYPAKYFHILCGTQAYLKPCIVKC